VSERVQEQGGCLSVKDGCPAHGGSVIRGEGEGGTEGKNPHLSMPRGLAAEKAEVTRGEKEKGKYGGRKLGCRCRQGSKAQQALG